MRKYLGLASLVVGGILFAGALPAMAYQIVNLPNTPKAGDYVIGPGKTEVKLDPGSETTKILTVVNRFGKDMTFKVEIEDFGASTNPNESMVLLGSEKGPYSLKDFLHPDTTGFTLKHGEQITIPVLISIPKDAQPGGLYGSVIITTQPIFATGTDDNQNAQGNVNVISRLASLYFVRVSGDVKEDGALKSFSSDKSIYQSAPFKFNYQYENKGSIYENPYGYIRVYNITGAQIDEAQIQPYFVMPGAARERSTVIDHGFMMGRYKAVLSLSKGYGNTVDEQTIYFWVLPWKIVLSIVLGLALILWLLGFIKNWFSKNFEFKRKQEKTEAAKEPEKKNEEVIEKKE